jgi:hypothetical protein
MQVAGQQELGCFFLPHRLAAQRAPAAAAAACTALPLRHRGPVRRTCTLLAGLNSPLLGSFRPSAILLRAAASSASRLGGWQVGGGGPSSV